MKNFFYKKVFYYHYQLPDKPTKLFFKKCSYGVLYSVSKKRTTYFQTAVTSFRIVEIKKVGRDSERARADLSNAYNYFSVTQLGAEIFEFKDDPVPKLF